MDSLRLSTNDLIHHVVKIGMDIYPTVEIPKERTRLNIFYEETRNRHAELCEQLTASDSEFRISKRFTPPAPTAGPAFGVDTFVLTNRGPLFAFPLRLPDPVGETNLEARMQAAFNDMKALFFSAITERKVMRIGLIRDLMFDTGQSPCEGVLSDRSEFAGARLKGGKRVLLYRDDLCNVRLTFEPAEVMKTTRLPVGTEVTERQSFGLHVVLDVNNHQPRPLNEADMNQVWERAAGFWPDDLLGYF